MSATSSFGQSIFWEQLGHSIENPRYLVSGHGYCAVVTVVLCYGLPMSNKI